MLWLEVHRPPSSSLWLLSIAYRHVFLAEKRLPTSFPKRSPFVLVTECQLPMNSWVLAFGVKDCSSEKSGAYLTMGFNTTGF